MKTPDSMPMDNAIPSDRIACDFPACRNYADGGFCLRSRKTAESCAYQEYREAYWAGVNRKDKLMIELLDLVRQGQKNKQIMAREIRKELKKRSTATLEKMADVLE